MTLEDTDTTTETTEGAAAATSTKPRRTGTLDIDAGTVEIKEASGAAVGIYAADDLPERVIKWLTIDALRRYLLLADNPSAGYAELQAGKVPNGRPGRPPKASDPWRQAYAHALAETEAEKLGVIVETRSGKPTAEFLKLLESAQAKAVSLSKEGLATAKKHAAVVAHHERLTGATVSLSDLA